MLIKEQKMMLTGENLRLAQDLLETIKFINQKGWSEATSTNYSVRTIIQNEIIISRSGVDKSQFRLEDFLMIDLEGQVLPKYSLPHLKSSAETEIHTALYKIFPDVNCVLHTHSILGTVLSTSSLDNNILTFENLEILKGLEGNKTHEVREEIPIVRNSQDMQEILRQMRGKFNDNIHGFLIQGHGLYTWAKDIATAKRHIETFEFLFEYQYLMRRMSWPI
jgi:methylthioribulose-1-phosphate dehydratase